MKKLLLATLLSIGTLFSQVPAVNSGSAHYPTTGFIPGTTLDSTASVPVLTQMTFAGQAYNDSPQALTVNASTGFPIFVINPGGNNCSDNANCQTKNPVWLVQCGDLPCTPGSRTATNLMSTVTMGVFNPDYTSVKQVEPGYIEVQFTDYSGDMTNRGLRFIRFKIADSTWTNNRVDDPMAGDGSYIYENAFYIDATDSYRVHSAWGDHSTVWVSYCGQSACSSVVFNDALGTQSNVPQDIVKGANGFPQLLASGANTARITTCPNIDCSGQDPSWSHVVAMDYSYYGTLELKANGTPDILYSASGGGNTEFVNCTITTGSTCSAPVVLASSDSDPGQLVLRSDVPSFALGGLSENYVNAGAYSCPNSTCTGDLIPLIVISTQPEGSYTTSIAFSGSTPIVFTTSNDPTLPAQLWYGQNVTQLTLMGQPVSGIKPSVGQSPVFDGLRWGLGGPFVVNSATGQYGLAVGGLGTEKANGAGSLGLQGGAAHQLNDIAIGNGAVAGTSISSGQSIAIGNSAIASSDATAIGNGAQAGDSAIAIGEATAHNIGIAIGVSASALAGNTVAIGHGVTINNSQGIGIGSGISDGGFNNILVLGASLTATSDNQILLGFDTSTDIYIGKPAGTGLSSQVTLHGHNRSPTLADGSGGDVGLAAGVGTGLGIGGQIHFQGSLAGMMSGSDPNSLIDIAKFDPRFLLTGSGNRPVCVKPDGTIYQGTLSAGAVTCP